MKNALHKAVIITILAVATVSLAACKNGKPESTFAPEKPVIYLYPADTADVTVRLEYDGVLDCTYPLYNDGWNVTAYPDGVIINHADGKEYSYLFWEGNGVCDYDFSKGFVVKGEDTAGFYRTNSNIWGFLQENTMSSLPIGSLKCKGIPIT